MKVLSPTLLFLLMSFAGKTQITSDSAYNMYCQKMLNDALSEIPEEDTATINSMQTSFDCPIDPEEFANGFAEAQKIKTMQYARLKEGESIGFCEKFAYEKFGIAYLELDPSTHSYAYIEGFNTAMREKIEFILGYDADSVGIIDLNCREIFTELEKQLTERFTLKVSGRGYYIYRIDLKYFPIKKGFDVHIHDINQTTSIEKLEKGILFANPSLKDSTTTVKLTFTLREPELPANRSSYWMHNRTLIFPIAIEPKFYK